MDFGTLLYAAHKNEKSAIREVKETKCYKTKFEPPKKEIKARKTNSLSVNVQKFLQKKEEEEKRKTEDEKKKKEELLALRSQDRKAFKRVQTMLKRTKSANKSVMEDAVDDVNTAITMNGPQQCDEDDYGYVSQEASAFYAKMMDKYSNLPAEEPKFSQAKKSVVKDLNAAKERVKAALHKVEEEEMMPHKRKRKSKGDKTDENEHDDEGRPSRDSSPVEEPKPKKPKKMAPPPMDFSSLLKLAEKKQFEPIQIEKKKVPSDDDERRPMTKRQKLEYEREREWRERKMDRENAVKIPRRPESLNRIPKLSDNREKPNGFGRIPKKSDAIEKNTKPESSESKKRKDSFDSDRKETRPDNVRNNYRESNGNSTSKDMSKYKRQNGDHHTNHERKTSIAANKIQSRKHSISEEEESEDDRERSYSKPNNNKYDNNYDRKPSQMSNKQQARKHSISEEESDEDDRGKPIPRQSMSSSSYSSKPAMSKSSQSSKSYHPEKRKPEERYRNGSDNDQSDSQSGNESNKYRPAKYNPESSQYQKYRPEAKGNKGDSRYSQPKPSKGYSCQQRSVQSDDEESNSSQNYRNKYEMAQSDSEDENKYKPSKKTNQSNNGSYRPSSNSILEKELRRDHSPPPSKSKQDSRVKQSSNYRPENRKSSSFQSSNKEKKISSLFEASDEEETPNGKRVIEGEKKLKSSSDRERLTSHSGDSKFKVPKLNQSGESDRKSQQSSYSSKPMESIKRNGGSERSKVSKPESSSRPNNNRYSDPKTTSDKGRPSNEKPKEKSKDIVKKESSESSKKQNPEEALKKSGSVWSKPCNQPNQPPPKAASGGLSESQLQRLREMNKKPTPSSRPTENSSRMAPPGRPPMGRPGEKPSLLKAAAAAAASRTPSQKPSPSSGKELQKPLEKQSSRPSERPSSSKTTELSSKNSKPKQFPPNDLKPRQFPPSDVKPRQFPPNDLKPRQFPPKDVQRARQFPPPDVRRRSRPQRIEDDTDEEYDSDMNDFIDDGNDMNSEDISREIQSIFGYDKSRNRYGFDDDDECMESNFGQIDREELRSLRIGALEDLRELENEKRMKERAKQRKKMAMKGR